MLLNYTGESSSPQSHSLGQFAHNYPQHQFTVAGMHAKFLLISSLLAVAVPPRALEEELLFSPEASTKMTIAYSMEASMDLVDQSVDITVDGEDRSPELPPTEVNVEQVGSITFTDQVLEQEDGNVTKLRRTFVEIVDENSQTVESDGGGGSETTEGESDLEGMTVVFTWDAEESEYGVEFDEDEDGDEELLEGLEFDIYMTGFLPDGGVSIGDSWEVEPGAMSWVVDPGGDLSIVSERDSEDDDERSQQIKDNLEGTINCTLKEVVEEDGARLAVIEMNIEITTGFILEEDIDMEQVSGTSEEGVAIEYELAGEYRWNLDAGVLQGFDVSGDISYTMTRTADVMQGETSIQQEMLQSFEGTRSMSAEVTFGDSDE
ncbi:MAG: hypothetical protein ACI8TQ_002876 [Planctomycetota bacterium]|jgi:hypothetical protein